MGRNEIGVEAAPLAACPEGRRGPRLRNRLLRTTVDKSERCHKRYLRTALPYRRHRGSRADLSPPLRQGLPCPAESERGPSSTPWFLWCTLARSNPARHHSRCHWRRKSSRKLRRSMKRTNPWASKE